MSAQVINFPIHPKSYLMTLQAKLAEVAPPVTPPRDCSCELCHIDREYRDEWQSVTAMLINLALPGEENQS